MPLFFIDPTQLIDNKVLIKGEDFHHLRHVLRLQKGDYLQISDGREHLYSAEIEQIGSHEAKAVIIAPLSQKSYRELKIVVGQALPKGQKMDLIVEKGTELGANAFVPLITDRVISKNGTAIAEAKLQRWRRIALEASKQSKRLTVPEVYAPMTLTVFCDCFYQIPCKLILWERASQGFKGWLSAISPPGEVVIIIGPEGGFSPQEISFAEQSGFSSLFLGGRILRTETVALVFLSLLQFMWGDLG